jgi:hypothetical protein
VVPLNGPGRVRLWLVSLAIVAGIAMVFLSMAIRLHIRP